MAEPNDKQKKSKRRGGSPKPDRRIRWSKIIRTVFSWGAVIIARCYVMQFIAFRQVLALLKFLRYLRRILNNDKIADAKIYKTDVNDYRFEGTLKQKENITIKRNTCGC